MVLALEPKLFYHRQLVYPIHETRPSEVSAHVELLDLDPRSFGCSNQSAEKGPRATAYKAIYDRLPFSLYASFFLPLVFNKSDMIVQIKLGVRTCCCFGDSRPAQTITDI
jgi:hypothetical protein